MELPPLWPEPPISAHLRHRRRPPLLLTPPVIIILFSILTLFLFFFAIPHFLSISNQFLKPASSTIRKSWDSLNVLLILFATLCGILACRNNEAATEEANYAGASTRSLLKPPKEMELTAQQWFESIEEKIFELAEKRVPLSGVSGLRRSSSSYPDLKQDLSLATGDRRFRSFDDSAIDGYHQQSGEVPHVPLRRWQSAIDETEIKEIPVDSFALGSPSPSPEASPARATPRSPPTLPPPLAVTQNKRQTYEAVRAATPPPPLLPPWQEQNFMRVERRKSSASKEIKIILASALLANKRKKTRLIQESVRRRTQLDETSYRRISPPSPLPPPAPLPPSFLSIFRKTGKSKRIHSVSAPPPAPPPPPEYSKRSSNRCSTKPPLPKKPKNSREDASMGHSAIAVGPPPPFTAVGKASFFPDRRRRCQQSGSADANVEFDVTSERKRGSSSDGCRAKEGGHAEGADEGRVGPGLVFCPSPDVNIKADTFIARLKDGWRLERMNSIREKHGLGPREK